MFSVVLVSASPLFLRSTAERSRNVGDVGPMIDRNKRVLLRIIFCPRVMIPGDPNIYSRPIASFTLLNWRIVYAFPQEFAAGICFRNRRSICGKLKEFKWKQCSLPAESYLFPLFLLLTASHCFFWCTYTPLYWFTTAGNNMSYLCLYCICRHCVSMLAQEHFLLDRYVHIHANRDTSIFL